VGSGGIAVDQAGCAHITGIALGDFTTVNAVQSNYFAGGTWDGFVLKLDPDGLSAMYATFLGGSQGAAGMGIAVDGRGNAYVTGNTSSTNFPMQNALQSAFGGGSCEICRLATPLSQKSAIRTPIHPCSSLRPTTEMPLS
jgi:hypothetical protein